MSKKYSRLLACLIYLFCLSQSHGFVSAAVYSLTNITDTLEGDSCSRIYAVKKIATPPVIDGVSGPDEWREAHPMEDIVLHWEKQKGQATLFKSSYDRKFFYFLFEATDSQTVTWPAIEQELDVIWEDRVELFFGCDPHFHKYYCLEIDALGRYLGNSGSIGQKIDVSWECKNCTFIGKTTASGFVVEGSIPLSTLLEMGVFMDGKPMITGVYRADFRETGKPKEPEMHWMSWVKSHSPTPNFHIPSSTGCFIFE